MSDELENAFRLTFVGAGEYDDLKPTFDFIEGTLYDSSVAIVYAPPQIGKTFFAIHLLCSTALARPVFGLKVERRRGLYIGLEGEAGIKARVMAWCIENGVKKSPIHYALGSINIVLADHQEALIAYMREHEIEFVVIDTLSMAATGIDENAASEMTLVIESLHNIKRETGACVVAIAHTGKNEKAGIRGHSSQLGNVDTTIEIEALNQKAAKGRKGEPDTPEEAVTTGTPRRARVRKQRDGEAGTEFHFRLHVHETALRNARGEPVRSVAVAESEFLRDWDAADAANAAPALTKREREAVTVLEDLTAKHARIGAPTVEQFRRALRAAKWGPGNSSSWRSAFQRLVDKLAIDSNGGIEHAH